MTGTRGGESMRTKSKSAASFSNNSAIGRDPSNSLGFGGISPAARIDSPVSPHGWMTSASEARPNKAVVRPTPPSMPSALATDGLRRSPSTRMTREPASAIARARLIVVVVLPSPGIAEVSTNECLPVVTSTNMRLVRSRRMLSA